MESFVGQQQHSILRNLASSRN